MDHDSNQAPLTLAEVNAHRPSRKGTIVGAAWGAANDAFIATPFSALLLAQEPVRAAITARLPERAAKIALGGKMPFAIGGVAALVGIAQGIQEARQLADWREMKDIYSGQQTRHIRAQERRITALEHALQAQKSAAWTERVTADRVATEPAPGQDAAPASPLR